MGLYWKLSRDTFHLFENIQISQKLAHVLILKQYLFSILDEAYRKDTGSGDAFYVFFSTSLRAFYILNFINIHLKSESKDTVWT